MIGILLAGGLILSSAAPAAPQNLPGDGFHPGWRASAPVRTFVEQDLFNHIDGGAELYLEFGFRRLRLQAFTDGRSEIVLEIYEMRDAGAALGIYLMTAGRESPWPGIPARNSSEDAQIVALKGRYLVKIDNFEAGASARPALAALAGAALAGIREEPPFDPFDRLPAEGRIPGTERLIRGPVALQPFFTFGEGDILRLGGTLDAVLAEYENPGGDPSGCLLVDYPAEADAAAAFDHLRANLDPYLTVVEESGERLLFRDFKGLFGRVERRGRLLELRFKMPDRA